MSVCTAWVLTTWISVCATTSNLSKCNRLSTETLPAFASSSKLQSAVHRDLGLSDEDLQIVLDQTELDVVLSYNHYKLQNTKLRGSGPLFEIDECRNHERSSLLGSSADERSAASVAQGHTRSASNRQGGCRHCQSKEWISQNWRSSYSNRESGYGDLM